MNILLSRMGNLSTSRSSFEISDFEKIWFYHFFQGRFFLSNYRSKRSKSNGTSGEVFAQSFQEFSIQSIQSHIINTQVVKNLGNGFNRFRILPYRCIISENFDITVGNSWGAPAFFCDKFIDRC